jgi:hypothetical protein
MSATNIPKINQDYLKKRMEQHKKQKEENSRFIILKNGENKIEINLDILPQEQPPKNGYSARMLYTTTTIKNGVCLLLSASNILDGLIIKALSGGYNPFTLIKVGEGINTRYAIKELEKN